MGPSPVPLILVAFDLFRRDHTGTECYPSLTETRHEKLMRCCNGPVPRQVSRKLSWQPNHLRSAGIDGSFRHGDQNEKSKHDPRLIIHPPEVTPNKHPVCSLYDDDFTYRVRDYCLVIHNKFVNRFKSSEAT